MIAHDEWLEQATAYALGALDAPAAAAFAVHLRGCDVCQREVRALSDVAGLLALAPVEIAPPPGLRDRVMARVRGVDAPAAAIEPPRLNGAEAPARPAREEGPATPPVATPPVAPPVETLPLRAKGRRSARGWTALPWVLLAASVAIAAPLAVDYIELRRELAMYVRASSRLQAEVVERGRMLASRDSALASIVGPEVRVVSMQATGRAPSGKIFWNPRSNRLVLAAYSIPPAPAGRTYQLWGLPEGNAPPVSLGTFNTSAAGETRVMLAVPSGTRIAASAITEEPAGGSAQPTTAPFLISTWPTAE